MIYLSRNSEPSPFPLRQERISNQLALSNKPPAKTPELAIPRFFTNSRCRIVLGCDLNLPCGKSFPQHPTLVGTTR